MRFKIRIIHKGLTLIAVPLFFGIAFVLLLSYWLSEADRKFQHELLLKDAMVTVDGINRRTIAARICAGAYVATHDGFFKESLRSDMREAAGLYKHLRNLLKSESGMNSQLARLKQVMLATDRGNRKFMALASSINLSGSDALSGRGLPGAKSPIFSDKTVYAIEERLRNLAGAEAGAVVTSMNRLQMTLTGGMLFSILLTMFLAVYFSRNITSRLLIIIDNTARLSAGMPLRPPLKGSDEIAELDEFLFKSAAEIRELERSKRELVGVVSHELKSPLSSIEGFLSAFSAGIFGELNKKAQRKAELAHKSVVRLIGLVKELVDLDRLAAGKLELSPEQISVDELIAASVESVRALSERSGISIEIKNDADKVFADRNRLVQVIVNLLSNAVKFSPPAGKVTVATSNTDGCLECRVSDQGRGIPESLRKEIFEPFKQVDAKDATTKKGTGLGLTISQSIVQQHGGKIGVDSVEGQGSTFWFRIPLSGDFQPDSDKCRMSESLPGQSVESSWQTASPILTGKPHASRAGRFNVFHKGLVLISVPLIFELVFVSVISFLMYQIQEQVRREEHSKEIVTTMNLVAKTITSAVNTGLMYVWSGEPECLASWQSGKKEALNMLEHVKELTANDAGQQKNMKETEAWYDRTFGALEQLVSSKESDFSTVMNGSGFVAKAKETFLEGNQTAEERLLAKEKDNGEKLAARRARMIKDTELALWGGLIMNILVSIGLAVYLMRSITNRLRHVMANTARLVKREPLEPPIKDGDEIAYLDQVFFEAGKHLVELETFKRELISIVSHELRTPLMSVSSSFELFSAGAFGELSEKGLKRLTIAEKETDRLIRLINNLLDIEKMEAGKFVLDISELNVSELIESAIAAVAPLAEKNKIKLESSVVDGSLRADRDRLSQVIINLLSNAIKFSPAGGNVKITVEFSDSEMMFRISDQGRGIPDNLKESIFNRFVQVEEKDASERGGSGLGLAITKSIVEQHGGQIKVESEPGRGSTFWFRLPVSNEAQDVLSRSKAINAKDACSSRS